jgi:hypothetical protein
MPRWEYNTCFSDEPLLAKDLDDKGKAGWELVAVLDDHGSRPGPDGVRWNFWYYFKRPVPDR